MITKGDQRGRKVSRKDKRYLKQMNATFGDALERMALPDNDRNLIEVWRSKRFLMQVFYKSGEPVRLSVNRTAVQPNGDWVEGITWEEMQRLKAECGRGALAGVEIYPPDDDIVNIANMRHMFVLAEPPAFMWKKGEKT